MFSVLSCCPLFLLDFLRRLVWHSPVWDWERGSSVEEAVHFLSCKNPSILLGTIRHRQHCFAGVLVYCLLGVTVSICVLMGLKCTGIMCFFKESLFLSSSWFGSHFLEVLMKAQCGYLHILNAVPIPSSSLVFWYISPGLRFSVLITHVLCSSGWHDSNKMLLSLRMGLCRPLRFLSSSSPTESQARFPLVNLSSIVCCESFHNKLLWIVHKDFIPNLWFHSFQKKPVREEMKHLQVTLLTKIKLWVISTLAWPQTVKSVYFSVSSYKAEACSPAVLTADSSRLLCCIYFSFFILLCFKSTVYNFSSGIRWLK